MKKGLVILASAFLLASCGGGPDEKAMSDYKADVCSCAMEADSEEAWNACNEKRKGFFEAVGADADNDTANKYNDEMVECLDKAS